MTLQTNLSNAFTRVATEAKALRTIINGNQPGLSLSGLGIAGTTLSVDATVAGKVELATNVDVATGTDSAQGGIHGGGRSFNTLNVVAFPVSAA